MSSFFCFFFFQAEDGIRDLTVTGVQTCALPICGRVFVATGLTTQGQGHQTTFAQIAADALGCDPADVTVVTGDTRKFNWGAGTFASRALVTSGNAIGIAALKVRDKVLRIAAELLEGSS